MEVKDVQLPPDAVKDFLCEKHVKYIRDWESNKNGFEYVMSEYLRMSGLYWCLTAMDLLHHREDMQLEEIAKWVESCRHPDGGYSSSPDLDPHMLYTLSAVQVLVSLDRLTPEAAEGSAKFIKAQQLPDGSFQGDKWGEIDTRFSFCALACMALLNKLDEIRIDAAADFVMKCMNFDGGFGVVPGSESHAGQIYCCVGALAIAGQLHRVDADLLGWWLAERQLPSGGFNGRPEKLPDVCYSWWVLTSLRILGRMHWIDADKLKAFILACQDSETGGFSDRPGDMVDPFHTLFGTAALSLLGDTTLKEINPVFCMPEYIIARAVDLPHLKNVHPVL
eukprot:m.232132 g.232132  ORF g.232132 m.232132 type:complete len:335 (+) comp19270_c0_seq1:139-1143(+)